MNQHVDHHHHPATSHGDHGAGHPPSHADSHHAAEHAGHQPAGSDQCEHAGHVAATPVEQGHQHDSHPGHSAHAGHGADKSLTRQAISATLHCLTGCAIGEVLGLVIGTALGWSTAPTIALAIGLAFLFGYALSILPLRRAGLAFGIALSTALAADTLSITVMEIVDNAVMLLIPGAMHAGLSSPLFWFSMAAAFAVAFVVTVPVNRWLIRRGKGHAVMHQYH